MKIALYIHVQERFARGVGVSGGRGGVGAGRGGDDLEGLDIITRDAYSVSWQKSENF